MYKNINDLIGVSFNANSKTVYKVGNIIEPKKIYITWNNGSTIYNIENVLSLFNDGTWKVIENPYYDIY